MYYDEISEGYEELHKKEQLNKISLIKQFFEPQSNKLLLDVGCGTGLTTKYWNCKKFGLDPAIKLLLRADKAYYVNGEAENMPFPDNMFDYVISITAIQNFHDIEKGLSEIKRVGKDFYILSFLKRSAKKDRIISLIKKYFSVEKEIQEDKDIILFLR